MEQQTVTTNSPNGGYPNGAWRLGENRVQAARTGQLPPATVEFIAPEMAREWLKNNHGNRKLARRAVTAYADAIRRGEWQCNGESIKFASDGSLMDGQHRLHAIIEAGRGITSIVVRGLNRADFDTIDIGRSRRLNDMLFIEGEKYCGHTATAISMLWKYLNGEFINHRTKCTNHTGMELLRRFPHLRHSMAFVESLRKTSNLPASAGIAGALHCMITAASDVATASRFMTLLASGAGLSSDDPIYLLRERLMANKTGRAKLPIEDVVALMIKAYNAHISGDKMKNLWWRRKGKSPEAFPIMVGFEPDRVVA